MIRSSERTPENPFPPNSIYLLIQRKYLRHFSDSLAGALAEQYPHARTHVLRVAHEAEHHRCRLVRADSVRLAHDAHDDGRLSDASDVHRRLEAFVDTGGVEENRYAGLREGNLMDD